MLSLNVVIGIFIFIIGLCIGSFLNVVILRNLSGESIVFPASKCPKCQQPLKWWHNIPIFSYIFLKGKCAFCKEKISLQYPMVELLTGYLYVCAFLKFGFSINLFFILVFISMFIVISVIDIKEHIAFDIHSYILAGFGLVYNFFNFGNLYSGHVFIFNTSFLAALLGILCGAGILALYLGLGYLFVKTMIIGPGDLFIAGAIGACFGLYVIPIIVIAFILQILIFVPIFLKKMFKKKDYWTISALFAFVIITASDYFYLNLVSNQIKVLTTLLYVLLITSGILLCWRVIKSMPENLAEINEKLVNDEEVEEDDKIELSHLPFGPALCGAALIFMYLA